MIVYWIFPFVALFSFLFGVFLFRSPLKAFEFQKKFYACINWRIEPISVDKEIRNTKLMGIFLMVFVAAAVVYVFLRA